MKQLSPERRKIVVLAAAIAASSGAVLLLQRDHPHLTAAWLGLLSVALVYVVVQLVKIKRQKS
jgi:hypothetical protein